MSRYRPVVPVGDAPPGMTDDQRAAALEGISKNGLDGEALGQRADAYFDDEYPVSVLGFLQALMRETWKDDAGSYSKWDRFAKSGGIGAIGKVVLGR